MHIWAATWPNQQSDCAPSENSDQPRHPPSLIRVFAIRMKKAWVLSYPLSAQRRLWSDWASAQSDLSLRWAHMPFCWFCHEAAYICLISVLSLDSYVFSNDTRMNKKSKQIKEQPSAWKLRPFNRFKIPSYSKAVLLLWFCLLSLFVRFLFLFFLCFFVFFLDFWTARCV